MTRIPKGIAIDPALRGHGSPKGQRKAQNPVVEARRAMAGATTEDQLLTSVTDALTVYGWRWTHWRRSDLALLMGHPGIPDIIAARNGRVLFLELKREGENRTEAQWAWMREFAPNSHAVTALTIRPSDLDALLRDLA